MGIFCSVINANVGGTSQQQCPLNDCGREVSARACVRACVCVEHKLTHTTTSESARNASLFFSHTRDGSYVLDFGASPCASYLYIHIRDARVSTGTTYTHTRTHQHKHMFRVYKHARFPTHTHSRTRSIQWELEPLIHTHTNMLRLRDGER